VDPAGKFDAHVANSSDSSQLFVICGLQGTSEGRKNNEKYKVSLKSGGVFQRPSCSGTTNNQMQSSPFPSHIALLLMVLLHVRKESNPPAFPLWMDPAGKFNAHVHHHHAAHASMFVEDQSSLSYCSTPCLMHSSVLILLIPSHPCECS
jgi:hypothetical protein